MAKLADAPDLGSGGQPWGFESLHAHHMKLTPDENREFFYYNNNKDIYMVGGFSNSIGILT